MGGRGRCGRSARHGLFGACSVAEQGRRLRLSPGRAGLVQVMCGFRSELGSSMLSRFQRYRSRLGVHGVQADLCPTLASAGSSMTESGPTMAETGQTRPKFSQMCSTGATSTDNRHGNDQVWSNFDRCWANFQTIRPTHAWNRPRLARRSNLACCRPRLAPNWSNLSRFRKQLSRHRQKMAQGWLHIDQLQAEFDQIRCRRILVERNRIGP